MANSRLFGASLACMILALPSLAYAMGSEDSTPAKPEAPACKTGYVYSEEKKRCVRQDSQNLQPSDFIRYGWRLARAEKYLQAIEVFHGVSEKTNPELLNGLGFAHRKLGHLVTGISYYQQALDIDPNYVLARSYLGEGYVQSGRIDLARQQLDEIALRCGKSCKEYVQLLRTIETGTANDW